MKKLILPVLLLTLSPLFSHGSEYTILSENVIKIEARFDTGEPFSHASVLVFPPEESEPAYTLQTDSNGIFHFSPDKAGTWILQVRGSEGHGLRINLPIDDSMISDLSGSGRFSMIQRLIMTACVLWGALGTALYFRKRRD